jgi:hypothetical protein
MKVYNKVVNSLFNIWVRLRFFNRHQIGDRIDASYYRRLHQLLKKVK